MSNNGNTNGNPATIVQVAAELDAYMTSNVARLEKKKDAVKAKAQAALQILEKYDAVLEERRAFEEQVAGKTFQDYTAAERQQKAYFDRKEIERDVSVAEWREVYK